MMFCLALIWRPIVWCGHKNLHGCVKGLMILKLQETRACSRPHPSSLSLLPFAKWLGRWTRRSAVEDEAPRSAFLRTFSNVCFFLMSSFSSEAGNLSFCNYVIASVKWSIIYETKLSKTHQQVSRCQQIPNRGGATGGSLALHLPTYEKY